MYTSNAYQQQWYKLTAKNRDILQDLYKDIVLKGGIINQESLIKQNQNTRIRNKKKIESFQTGKLFNDIALHGIMRQYWKEDLFISMNTFKANGTKQGTGYMRDLYAVNCFALDVDFKKNGNETADPISYYYECISKILPLQPTWIEYGHNLRMIYVLREPIKYQLKKSKSVILLLKRVQAYLCDMLNEELDCTCEKQPLNSYIRVIGSINSKDNSEIKYKKINNEYYTIQEIAQEVLPELPEWYTEWKQKKRTLITHTNKKIYQIHNEYELWSNREAIFKKIQTEESINREKLIFWYGVSLLWQDHGETKDLINKLIIFNKGIRNPLPEKEIKSKFRTLKETFNRNKGYHAKGSTLIEEINIDIEKAKEIGLMGKREMEKLEKIAKGETRQQRALKNYETYKVYKEQGMKIKDIAEKMGLKIDTIKSYGRKYKREKEEK